MARFDPSRQAPAMRIPSQRGHGMCSPIMAGLLGEKPWGS